LKPEKTLLHIASQNTSQNFFFSLNTNQQMQTKLNTKWSLWFDDYKPESVGKDYEKNLILVSSFDTIEVNFSFEFKNPFNK
jgi:hypothetical protein